MEPWYKVATPRKEVCEGRSFNPDEFAIALEQVVARRGPEDYWDPAQFFARTCFTRALREHAGMVIRRLSGETQNTAPVLTLITQFGGGKTHTLTTLYHLATNGDAVAGHNGVSDLVREAGVASVPKAKVAVFVGNAWDPQPGRETPWIDIARQLAGDNGVEALGPAAKTTPPGTDSIARVFQAAGAPVLLLFDEVLNYLNRHRGSAESFHAFIQNLTVATTGTTHGAAVISLPRSQVEMTGSDQEWQDKISKVVRRVAKDLIANDETEISEVVRRRLFQDLGSEKIRRNVAKAFGDWCFERRAQLPPEWTAVDSAATEAKAREFLQRRFEACYPFHPATLSVFQRRRVSARLERNHSSRLDRRRSRSPDSEASCWVSSESRASSPRSTRTSPASKRTARRSTPIPRDRCETSIGVSALRSYSNHPVGRPIRSRTSPSCASRSASRSWTRHRSTTPRWLLKVGRISSGRRGQTGSESATSRP
jgi:predicted AAA+ superfamily ATPase